MKHNSKSIHLVVAFMFISATSVFSQDVVWASKVVSFSSQVGNHHHSANKALGKPDSKIDSTKNGWQPMGSGKEESIVVGFDKLIHAKKVLIVEAMNTGYIRRVAIIGTDDLEYDVASFPVKPGTKNARLVQINVADFNIEVKAVKVVLVPIRNVSTTIDAIGVTSSDESFVLSKNHEIVIDPKTLLGVK